MSHLHASTKGDDRVSQLRADGSVAARKPAPRTPKFTTGDWAPFPTDSVVQPPPAEAPEGSDVELPQAPPLPPPLPARRRRARPLFLSGLVGLLLGSVVTTWVAVALSRPEPRPAPPPPPEPFAPIAGADAVVAENGKGTYTTLVEAVAKAAPGSRIRVLPGVYRGAIVLDKAVEIVGAGEPTDIILECTDGNTVEMKTDCALLRNLTIRAQGGRDKKLHAVNVPRGRLVVEDCDLTSDSAACVLVAGADAAPEFFRCKVHNAPIGIEVADHGRGLFDHCEVTEATQAAVLVRTEAAPYFRHTDVHHGHVGVSVVEKGRGTFDDCTIHDHSVLNMEVQTRGDPLCNRCVVSVSAGPGRPSSNSIAVKQGGLGTFNACQVLNSPYPAVVIAQGGNPRLVQCQISGGGDAGIFVRDGGIGCLIDCDISSNKASGVVLAKANGTMLHQCRIHDNGDWGLVATDSKAQYVDVDFRGNKSGTFGVSGKNDVRHLDRP